MDPHDPYGPDANPDPAFTGAAPMPDAATVQKWRALYDGEVRSVDKQIARLLQSVPRDNTLVIVTADHGEEFMEHGYLKHGPNLFEESLHVPLIFNGPGVKRGRVRELTRLVDVVPTIASLLELKVARPVERRWSGVSLANVVTSGAKMPHLDAISETFGFGPLRWCIDDGTKKAFFFNKGHKLPVEYPAMAFPLHWIETHLPEKAVYVKDREISDEPALRWGLAQANEYVKGKVGGTWVSIRGDGQGGRVTGSVKASANAHLVPFFWQRDDRVVRDREGFRIDVANDGVQRLAVILGDTSGPARRERPDASAIGFFTWEEPNPQVLHASPSAHKELIAQLRALGYIQ